MEPVRQQPAMISVKAPVELRNWLKSKASEGYRSLNAQVVLLLSAAMAEETRKNGSQQ